MERLKKAAIPLSDRRPPSPQLPSLLPPIPAHVHVGHAKYFIGDTVNLELHNFCKEMSLINLLDISLFNPGVLHTLEPAYNVHVLSEKN